MPRVVGFEFLPKSHGHFRRRRIVVEFDWETPCSRGSFGCEDEVLEQQYRCQDQVSEVHHECVSVIT